MIDFKYTWQFKGIIGYQNEKAETVKKYPLSELEKYIEDNDLLNTGEVQEVAACECPFSKKYQIVQIAIYTPISEYIDNNWYEVTEKFYNFKNPNDFQSSNTEQETNRDLK